MEPVGVDGTIGVVGIIGVVGVGIAWLPVPGSKAAFVAERKMMDRQILCCLCHGWSWCSNVLDVH